METGHTRSCACSKRSDRRRRSEAAPCRHSPDRVMRVRSPRTVHCCRRLHSVDAVPEHVVEWALPREHRLGLNEKARSSSQDVGRRIVAFGSCEQYARVHNRKLDRATLRRLKQHTRKVPLGRREQSHIRVAAWDRQKKLGRGRPCKAIRREAQRDILTRCCTGRICQQHSRRMLLCRPSDNATFAAWVRQGFHSRERERRTSGNAARATRYQTAQ